MKKLFIVKFIFFSPLIFSQKDTKVEFAESISKSELMELLYVYASDYFAGRDTGSEGQIIANNFLRDFYKSHGIKSAKGIEDKYFQNSKT